MISAPFIKNVPAKDAKLSVLSISVSSIVVLIASLVAATTDIWKFKVYNLLTFPLLLSGLAYRGWTGGTEGLRDSLAGMALGFVLFLLPYMWGAFGAGDVKFIAAVGAWLGMQPMLPILLIGCLATGVYALTLMVMHDGYREAWTNLQVAFYRLTILGRQLGANDNLERVQTITQQQERRKRLIPFSAMITVGIITTIVWNMFS